MIHERRGGTLASALAMFSSGTTDDMKVLGNPFSLSPSSSPSFVLSIIKTDLRSPVRANHTPRNVIAGSVSFRGKKTWGGFFVMAPHNAAIVRRTWGILEQASPSSIQPYGPSFEYEELMKTPGPISAIFLSIILYVSFMSLALFSPVRWALGKYGPQPGEGPSLEAQQSGSFLPFQSFRIGLKILITGRMVQD